MQKPTLIGTQSSIVLNRWFDAVYQNERRRRLHRTWLHQFFSWRCKIFMEVVLSSVVPLQDHHMSLDIEQSFQSRVNALYRFELMVRRWFAESRTSFNLTLYSYRAGFEALPQSISLSSCNSHVKSGKRLVLALIQAPLISCPSSLLT